MPAACGSHVNVESGGFENPDDGIRDFRADAVAGNERDGVFHCRTARRLLPPAAYCQPSLLLPGFPIQQHKRADDVDHHQLRRALMKLVKSHAPRVACGQARWETADLLLDRVDFAQYGEA